MEQIIKTTKERCPNFSNDEIMRLKELIEKYAGVLLNKTTDATSSRQKTAAWLEIEKEFNASAFIYRSVKQLKLKFENMKKIARREVAREKQGLRKTGGGPSNFTPGSETDWVRSIIPPISLDGENSIYDDDASEPIVTVSVDPVRSSNNDVLIGEQIKIINVLENVNTHTLESDREKECDINNEVPQTTTKVILSFDSSTPTSILRVPISTPLKRNREKTGENLTPLQLRRKFHTLTTKKCEWTEARLSAIDTAKEQQLEEHKLKMRLIQEKHAQELKFNEEKHNVELQILQLNKEKLQLELELLKRQIEK
ncbi:hypothetical protein EVAR_6924_1 [Eumeta japonica]|uniref:Regulatory protein zeste n=1 Tax=Eumeta variegata TaxID=151549 RepID=A0A4C1TJ09_EUMVA|nr:hypothetical protein EVAR_6924_1 [Eumeta japonica]